MKDVKLSHRHWSSVSLFTVIVALLILGCVTPSVSPPLPSVDGVLAVNVLSEQPSSLTDTPVGCHRVENSQFAIIGRKDVSRPSGSDLMTILLDGRGSGASSKMLGTDIEEIMRMDLAQMTRDALRSTSGREGVSTPWDLDASTDAVNTLEIKPYVFISPDTKSRARIWVFLKTSLAHGSWGTRYVYYVPGDKPMFGDGGWFEDDGALLKDAVTDGLEHAVQTMIEDCSRTRSGWKQEPAKISTRFAGTHHVTAYDGWILKQDTNSIVFSPKVRGTFSGVHVAPAKEVVVRASK